MFLSSDTSIGPVVQGFGFKWNKNKVMDFDALRLRRSLNKRKRDSVRQKVRSNLEKLEKKLGRKVVLVQRHLGLISCNLRVGWLCCLFIWVFAAGFGDSFSEIEHIWCCLMFRNMFFHSDCVQNVILTVAGCCSRCYVLFCIFLLFL